MSTPLLNSLVLLAVGLSVFAAVVVLRRHFGDFTKVDPTPWLSTLSYVATAYGIIVGFSIIFLFGEFADARRAVGDEATSIGTAFEEAELFPASSDEIQQALICYGLAVPRYEWPALQEQRSSPEVDQAFAELVASLGENDEPPAGALHAAAATNLVSQVGSISTARETRLVAAETQVPPMLWVLLVGGGLFVIALIFVVTLPAKAHLHASLVATSAMFTVVMLMLVLALSTPFASGSGRVSPRLIEETVESMQSAAPTLSHCDFEETP